ncbi:hypothetical protein, partial [Burkholderia thailandensis]
MNYDRAANAAANRTQTSLRGEARGTSRAARPRPRIASRFAAFLVFRRATSAPPAGQAHAACARNAASRIASSSGATPAGSGQQRPDKKPRARKARGFRVCIAMRRIRYRSRAARRTNRLPSSVAAPASAQPAAGALAAAAGAA